jgi:hypothetical protein
VAVASTAEKPHSQLMIVTKEFLRRPRYRMVWSGCDDLRMAFRWGLSRRGTMLELGNHVVGIVAETCVESALSTPPEVTEATT